MPGTARGADTTAARRLGMSPVDYAHRLVSDEKWCCGCKAWHPIDDFGADVSRTDGRAAICRREKNRQCRTWYATHGRVREGRS